MRRPAVVAVVVAVAAVLVGTSTPPASAAPHRGESITVVFVGTPGVSGTVVARGSVFDIGTLTPSDSDTDALVFRDGTLLIHQSGTTVVHPPTPPACIVRFTTTGTYHVVGGTGRIAGATGAGNNRLRPRAGQPIRDRLRGHRAVRLRQDRHPRKPDHPVSCPLAPPNGRHAPVCREPGASGCVRRDGRQGHAVAGRSGDHRGR